MKNNIEARTDYGTKIKNNLIELVKAIKEHLLSYQENQYNMAVIFDSLKTMVNLCQKEGKIMQDYTKQFRVTREVFETQIRGSIAIPKALKEISGYTKFPTNQDQHEKNKIFQDQIFKQLLAYAYLDNADQLKYGSILTRLNT